MHKTAFAEPVSRLHLGRRLAERLQHAHLRRTKVVQKSKKTGNLSAVQLLLGHIKRDSMCSTRS